MGSRCDGNLLAIMPCRRPFSFATAVHAAIMPSAFLAHAGKWPVTHDELRADLTPLKSAKYPTARQGDHDIRFVFRMFQQAAIDADDVMGEPSSQASL